MENRRIVTFVVGSMLTASVALADILEFNAVIDGDQAVNCAGSGSPGTGTGSFTLDTVTGLVNYNIVFSGLIGDETQSHVHGKAPMCVGAGVVYPLPLGSPKIGSTTLTAAQMANMIAGRHYVNIHTTFDASGEIRGQIFVREPCPWDCADGGNGDVGITDFLKLLADWGGASACDFDGGGVGITDFLELLSNWGPCP